MARTVDRRSFSGALGTLLVLLSVPLAWAATAGSFQPVGQMAEGRVLPQATLLADGTVLVTGGTFIGDPSRALASAERFDPKTNTFSTASAMLKPRDESHRATRLQDGRVLITGGSADLREQLTAAEIYDPTNGTFSATGNLTQKRAAHSSTLLPDGRVLIAGGWSTSGPTHTAEIFDPGTGKFQATASMAKQRYHHATVTLADGRAVILGGTDAQNEAVHEVEIYDPATGKFSTQGQIIGNRSEFFTATLLLDGKILLAGGADYPVVGGEVQTVQLSSAELYDPATGQSISTQPMGKPRMANMAILLGNGSVLVAGGRSETGIVQSTELVDPATGKVTPGPMMTGERGGAAVVPLPDGRTLIAGGLTNGTNPNLATADVYVP